MEAYVDASDLASLDFERQESPFDYPTPSVSSDSGTIIKEEEGSNNKKKRKAWGQPVPEIVQILPPRKRAKTAEEKEQRKNERILRNRRAADKSRQRQKAAQAGLEQQNKDLIAENAQLKALLETHGLLSNYHFSPPPSVDLSPEPQFEADSPQPDFSQPTSAPPTTQESPCLAPPIDLEQGSLLAPVLDTGLTQYPAVSADLGQEASTASTDLFGQYGIDTDPLHDDIDYLVNFNALADGPALPNFGASIDNDLNSVGINCPEQFPADSYFDFHAFDSDTTCDLPYEDPQPTSGMQSQFSASTYDGCRQGFATETY